MKTALIAGASGLVGSNLLKLLLSSNEYQKVISVGRRNVEMEDPKLEQYIVPFEDLRNLDFQIDVVFCCLGTTIKKAGTKEAFRRVDFEFPKLLAQYSLSKGAQAFHIVTAMGADSNSSIFYNSVKGEIEDVLKSTLLPQIEIYRPSLLLGERSEQRFMEGVGQVLMKLTGFLFIGKLRNYKAIDASAVARYMYQQSLKISKGLTAHLSGEMQ